MCFAYLLAKKIWKKKKKQNARIGHDEFEVRYKEQNSEQLLFE